jgi:hypothetical protein
MTGQGFACVRLIGETPMPKSGCALIDSLKLPGILDDNSRVETLEITQDRRKLRSPYHATINFL